MALLSVDPYYSSFYYDFLGKAELQHVGGWMDDEGSGYHMHFDDQVIFFTLYLFNLQKINSII
jgi:hypothetical protein